MSQTQLISIALVTILGAFSVQAQANPPKICQTATGMPNVNASLFAGQWFEQVRAPAINVSCVQVNVNVVNNQTQLNISSNYSPTKNGLVMTKHIIASVNVSDVNANAGFNVSHNIFSATYKILSTDYTSYLVVCGYTNATDAASSFGNIFTRQQMPNSTWLLQLSSNSSQQISGFADSTAGNITQSKSCHPSSASTPLPTLAALLAAFCALLKIAY